MMTYALAVMPDLIRHLVRRRELFQMPMFFLIEHSSTSLLCVHPHSGSSVFKIS